MDLNVRIKTFLFDLRSFIGTSLRKLNLNVRMVVGPATACRDMIGTSGVLTYRLNPSFLGTLRGIERKRPEFQPYVQTREKLFLSWFGHHCTPQSFSTPYLKRIFGNNRPVVRYVAFPITKTKFFIGIGI